VAVTTSIFMALASMPLAPCIKRTGPPTDSIRQIKCRSSFCATWQTILKRGSRRACGCRRGLTQTHVRCRDSLMAQGISVATPVRGNTHRLTCGPTSMAASSARTRRR
jgi:hypothetical protein